MEHTEAIRRARVDAMLPYMYAGWTRSRRGEVWKAGYAQPVSACWHSALSPVLASLDLFDANYLPGQAVTSDLYLINDSWHDAQVHVDLLLTDECPEFIPEAECFRRPRARWSFDFHVPADTLRKMPVTWRLPEESGNYWLTARTTGLEGRPVLSQRFVRAVPPPQVPAAARRRTCVLLGADADSEAYFRERQLATSHATSDLSFRQHVVLVWNPARLTAEERSAAPALCAFAAAGGRVAVLAAADWTWRELSDVRAAPTGGSRVFPYEGTNHWILKGIDPECLKRWNGLPGTVAAASLELPGGGGCRRILWVREPRHTVVAEVPAASGTGSVLFVQLDLRGRVRPSQPHYDPVAEQVLINILYSEAP